MRKRSVLDRHILPTLGNRPVGSIKPSTVAAALGTSSHTLAPGTVGQVLRQVRQILDAALADGLVANNAAKSVKAPAAPRRRDVHLTDDDVAAVIAAVPVDHRALVITLIGTGLRISEACGLRVEDIDFLRRTLQIRQQRRPSGKFGQLKTGCSRRDIPADDTLLDALAEQIRRWPRHDGLVFSSSSGRPLTKAIAGHEFDAIEPAVGFSVSPHSLRHYFGESLHLARRFHRRRLQLARPLQPRNHLPRIRLPQARRRASRPRRDRQNHAPGPPACVPSVYREGCRVTSTPTNTGLKLQGVLFDMDGTLLDSEKLWDVALEDIATALGGDLSPRARRRMVGSSLARSIAIMHDDLGIVADPQSSAAYLTERAVELFHRSGVEAGRATAAARGSRCRCASRPRHLDESPPHRDRPGRSRARVVRGQCVRRRGPPCKAASGALSTAAALIGAIPDQCVAIEDSPLGIAAAEAAECAVLAVPSEVAIEPAPSRSVRDSLAGLTVQHLVAMVRARSDPRVEPDGQQA